MNIKQIFSENIEISKKKIFISENSKKTFKFYTSRLSKYSLLIKFDINEVDTKTIYILLKSYINNKDFLVLSILTTEIEGDSNPVYRNIDSRELNNMGFEKFILWWEKLKNSENKYINNSDLYGMLLLFEKKTFSFFLEKKLCRVEEIRPIYPWREEILKWLE